MGEPAHILVVDDDREMRDLLSLWCALEGYSVLLAEDMTGAIEALLKYRPDLVVITATLPDGDGDDLARLAQAMKIAVLLTSGHPETIARLRDGPAPFISKPFRLGELDAKIGELLKR